MQASNASCLPELVKLVNVLASRALDISVPELAELIQHDTTVLARVISAANSMGFNPNRIPIDTATQAIQTIGFERVRTLTMSLMLLQHAENKATPIEQKEMATLCLCSGLIAQSAAVVAGDIDPEQAFVCASLRNFGKLLLSTFMNDHFRQAEHATQDHATSDDAFRKIFGLTPLDLGQSLLKAAKLPDVILKALRECKPASLIPLKEPERRLLLLSEFSLQYADLTLEPDIRAGDFDVRASALHRHFGDLAFTNDQLQGLLQRASDRLETFRQTFKIDDLAARASADFRCRLSNQDLQPRAPRPAYEPKPIEVPRSVKKREETDGVVTIASKRTSATPPVSTAPPATAEQAMMLSRIAKLFGADECLFLSAHHSGDQFTCQLAQGLWAPPLRGVAQARRADRTIIGVCANRRENILIHNASDKAITSYLPDWLRPKGSPGALVLIPVQGDNQLQGIILVGWKAARQIVISPDHAELIRSLTQPTKEALAQLCPNR